MECVVKIYKHGKFYNVYGNDAIVVSVLTNYKVINNRLGFPISMINKVIGLLDRNKISYIVFDKDNIIEQGKGIKNRYFYIFDKYDNQ